MKKAYLLFGLIGFVSFSLIVRLFYIQIIDDSYKLNADSNAIRKIKLYAPRGTIFDREGRVMVANQPAYDLLAIPNQVQAFDSIKLCALVGIELKELRRKLNEARAYSRYKPSPVVQQMSQRDFGRLGEQLYSFKGFYIQKRTLRRYPEGGAANVVGFVGEVTDAYIKNHPEYERADLHGATGIEKSYEEALRGVKGVRYVLVDVHNREKGSFRGGAYDTTAVPGSNLVATIDLELQLYAEQLMKNKRGSIVAIEPSTGEILLLVTSPTFDPNLLVGRDRSKNYRILENDSFAKPLYDRALLAEYPPGSPFKLVNALVGLQLGTLDTLKTYTCHHGFHAGSLHVACHCGTSYPLRLIPGIAKSCNNFFCSTFRDIIQSRPTSQEGMDVWSQHVKSFGLGQFLQNDLPTGRKGLVPDADYYDRAFGYKGWRAVSTISLGIGQGELLLTPLQMANLGAIIANRGFYYTPHIVRTVGDTAQSRFERKRTTLVEPRHFEPVVEGMHQVFEAGTARGSRIESIPMCGKTGTAENPHGQDHSIFIAFAPKDNPKIAISIIVENGYWGSRWAAPIASLLMERYLHDSISRPEMEKRMIEGDLSSEYRLNSDRDKPRAAGEAEQ